jgi:uncharacterized protein (DUF1800 family)
MRSYLALNRFGLGARAGDAAIGDPERWLLSQIDAFQPAPPSLAALPARPELTEAVIGYLEVARGVRQVRADAPADGLPRPAMQENPEVAAALAERREGRRSIRELYIDAVHARTVTALQSTTPFMERWVHFWSNHFAVSVDKLVTAPFAGDYEFRAIRPFVRGRFATLLRSAIRHPAMLLYLDQAQSFGPDSMIAQRVNARRQRQQGNGQGRQLGLNENLAREILELHTLGVRSGYSQTDVTAFAHALTGHTISGMARGPAQRLVPAGAVAGETVFIEPLHQPGAQTVLGRRYDQRGSDQADAILADLAVHPATARHIATKVARHFVADDPPAALVARLEADFLRSGGDLASLARTLIRSPESWATDTPKFKSPWDWLISTMRGMGVTTLPDRRASVGLFDQLGQPVWRPGSPAGYADTVATWAGPQALADRVDIAERLASRVAAGRDARALAPTLLADALTPDVATAIARADSAVQGLALLVVAPAFLRR